VTTQQVTFTLNRGDFVRSSRAILNRRRDTKALYLFIGLGALLLVGANVTLRYEPDYGRLALYLAGLTAVALVLWFSPWLSVNQNLKNHTLAFVPQTWHFSPSGVQIVAGTARSSFEWPVVVRVVEDSNYIFLYVSDAMAYPIPKRALAAEEYGHLKEGLCEWLGPRAEL
jgi:hypothetical protein